MELKHSDICLCFSDLHRTNVILSEIKFSNALIKNSSFSGDISINARFLNKETQNYDVLIEPFHISLQYESSGKEKNCKINTKQLFVNFQPQLIE